MRRLGILAVLLASASPAVAGDQVLYQPVPQWVVPAPPIEPAKLGADAPVALMVDNQNRLEGGQVWSYYDTATVAATSDLLGKIGTIQLPWQPSQGDLIVHRLEIVRGAQRIDLIHGTSPFSVLRREEQLGSRILDGQLTATLPVEGLQVGDVLHMMVSITRRDTTLKGQMQATAPLLALPTRVGFARARFLWPTGTDVRWKAYADGVTAKPIVVGGYNDLTIALPLAKQPEIPDDAPARYRRQGFVEASSFADWAAVSKVMAPLYASGGLIVAGSPLAAEVARIKAASPDPVQRATLALQMVQGKIRYLLMGMQTGNYVPQTPTQTWTLRYGDCKAKTLLLLAMLHELGIVAEPVLASSKLGDAVPTRLPSAGAFDHVLVRATVGERTLWLDGTDSGARLADIGDTPTLGWVLPVRTAGADPIHIELQPTGRPLLATTIEFDQRAGIALPAAYTGTTTVRGGLAEAIRAAAAQGSKDDLDRMAAKLIKQYAGDDAILTGQSITFDDAAGTATVATNGIAYPNWERKDGRLQIGLDQLTPQLKFDPDRARAAWRDIPVAAGDPGTVTVVTTYRLPSGSGFTVEGPTNYNAMVGGEKLERKVVLEGNVLRIAERVDSLGSEVAVKDIPAARQQLAAVKRDVAYAKAPVDYPQIWDAVAAGRRQKLIDPLLALYTKRIAAKPDEQNRITDRAWFLERVYDRKGAVADLDKAIAMEPTVAAYTSRSGLRYDLGDVAGALADSEAAQALDPGADAVIRRIAWLKAVGGDTDGAVAMLDHGIDAGGEAKVDYIFAKANAQAIGGRADAAIATMDVALIEKPKDSNRLDFRCWTKGIMGVALDSALKDCTRAIELSDDAASALDSRAMVEFKLGKFDDALVDLNSALDGQPENAGSLFLRGVVQKRLGKARESEADLAAARILAPQIAREYKRWSVTP